MEESIDNKGEIPRSKHTIEFHIVGDGREFLNFWDWAHGNDVVAEIIRSPFHLLWTDPEGNELPITMEHFLNLVRESIAKRNI